MTASASTASKTHGPAPSGISPAAKKWVEECITLCQPKDVYWCNGSPKERKTLLERGVKEGVFIKLNQEKLPGCYLHRSNPNDVARTEHLTFVCTPSAEDAGPTNNWMDPKKAYATLAGLYKGCMKGKTMYVLPFVMGPLGSPMARVGIQLTDSNYVAVNMGIMTRMGDCAWKQLDGRDDFTRCLHAVADCNPERRYICHFPQDNTIWSFGSGYGGNALLGKKCLSLRIAGYLGRQQGWMAEHMLLMGVTAPNGIKTYVAGAFPSACGKTNFAMLIPPDSYSNAGWKITTIGDDIAWMYVNPKDGLLHAINPESGYFGVAPGTNYHTNPNAMHCISRDTIFTNVALLPDGDVWWEGKTETPPTECLDWCGQHWTPDCGRKAAHPNSRFTAPMANNPVLDPMVDAPEGVPVGAIIFGGRRSDTVPVIYQAFNWAHGVFLGATLGSETTAAAVGQVGTLRRDPMAMLPFCGYDVNEYFQHWLRMRKRISDPPKIFSVNWFRKDENGKFMWPGFCENMRILEWILGRVHGKSRARETVLGWMPKAEDINLNGLGMNLEQFEAAQAINVEAMKKEIISQEELFIKLSDGLPKELLFHREMLISRL